MELIHKISESVFINYRREDAGMEAGRIASDLQEEIGDSAVFLDTSSVEPGATWPDRIKSALKNCHVVLIVIGPDWLRLGEMRWSGNPGDWVRIEISSALQDDTKTIIPITVRGGNIPTSSELPSEISKLSSKQALDIRTDYWSHDIKLLISRLCPDEQCIDSAEAHGDIDKLFSSLIMKTFRATYETLDDPFRSVALKELSNHTYTTIFSLENFIAEDLSNNKIISELQDHVYHSWLLVPSMTRESANIARRNTLEKLEKHFHKRLAEESFSPLRDYFTSENYGRNVRALLRNEYYRDLQAKFAEDRIFKSNMTLKDIFVPPAATINSFCVEDPKTDSDHKIADLPEFLCRFFESNDKRTFARSHQLHHNVHPNCSLIFGYPGQGKSSLCKKIAYDVANGAIVSIKNVYLLPLRYVPAASIEGFLRQPFEYIREQICKHVYQNRAININDELRHCLLLLDGLDELDLTNERSEGFYLELLNNLFRPDPGISVLVTSRYLKIDIQEITCDKSPLIMSLRSFDSQQQKRWVEKYQCFYPNNKLTPDIIDKVNLYEDYELRLNDLKETVDLLKGKKTKIELNVEQARSRLANELNVFEVGLRKELAFDMIEGQKKQTKKELDRVNTITGRTKEILQELYPTMDLSRVEEAAKEKGKEHKQASEKFEQLMRQIENRKELKRQELAKIQVDPEVTLALELTKELEEATNEIVRIEMKLSESESYKRVLRPIRELVSQPLLLYLIGRLDIDLERENEIVSRSSLYRELMNRLTVDLFGQIVERDYDNPKPRRLRGVEINEYREFIRELAFAAFSMGSEVIRFSQARKHVGGFSTKFDAFYNANPHFLDSILPTFYFKHHEYNDEEEGAIEFAHKSFREYMAAELILERLAAYARLETDKTERKLLDTLSTRIITKDLLEFLVEVNTALEDNRNEIFEALGNFFVDKVLTVDFLHRNPIELVCTCFYNTLQIINATNAYGNLPEELKSEEKRSSLVNLLQLFLIEHSNELVNVPGKSISALDLRLNVSNVKFHSIYTDKGKEEDHINSQSHWDFYK